MIKALATKRLLLKPIEYEDRDFILAQFSDSDVTRFMYDEEPMTDISEADALIDRYLQSEKDGAWRWVIALKDTHEKIGTCGFHNWDKTAQSIEAGYDIIGKYQGNGLMYEAMTVAIEFTHHTLGIKSFNAIIAVDNKRSILLAERLGFQFNGHEFWDTFRELQYLHRTYCLSLS